MQSQEGAKETCSLIIAEESTNGPTIDNADEPSVRTPTARGPRTRMIYGFVLIGAVLLVVGAVGYLVPPGTGTTMSTQLDDAIGLDAISAELSDSEKVNILHDTNWDRCIHGALPVTWNPTVAWSAQKQVDRFGFKHSTSRKYGENLAMNSNGKVRSMVQQWYSEVKYSSNGKVYAYRSSTGHYSQLVWKGTNKIGCGMKNNILNCEYSPAGNMRGAFRDNVGATTHSSSSCNGAGYDEYSRSYGTPKSGDKWQIKHTCSCTDVCRKDGTSYHWCHTHNCGGKKWDHCTPASNGTPKKFGCSCKSICDYGKRDNSWCYFYKQKGCGQTWGDCAAP